MNGEIVITQRERSIPYTKLAKRPEKGYSKPLPPKKEVEVIEKIEQLQPPAKILSEPRKRSPWMDRFTYGKNDPRNLKKKREKLVAPQLASP
jgi:hypothetical protein